MPRRSKSTEEDAALEIEAIAARTDESVRRVRARVEKEGGPDSLMTQILERKVVDRILEDTVIEDVQTTIEPEEDVETIDYVLKTPVAAGEAEQRHLIFKERSMPLEPPLADPFLQRYRDYTRQRQMTLGDMLLENRIVFLEGVINDAVANLAVMKFLFLQYENRTQGISFYINSPGGSVSSTLAIYDTMQFIECPIATYCIGLAASGAAVLLAGGSKGRRYALPHSKIMIHQPYGQVGGQVSDIEIQAEEIIKSKQVINEILARHTGQPIERVSKDTERDRYLTAAQAKEYGLVDEVVGRIAGLEKGAVRTPCLLIFEKVTESCHWSPSSSNAAVVKSGRWISIPASFKIESSSWARRSTTRSPTWSSPRCSSWPIRMPRPISISTSTAPAAA